MADSEAHSLMQDTTVRDKKCRQINSELFEMWTSWAASDLSG